MTKRINVVIIEAGTDYTERLETLSLSLPADPSSAVKAAAEHVAGLGYTVIGSEDGGACEYVAVTDPGEDYIAITVEPGN